MITPRTRLSAPLNERINRGTDDGGRNSFRRLSTQADQTSGIRGFAAVLAFCFSFYVSEFLTPLSSDHLRKLFLSLRFGD